MRYPFSRLTVLHSFFQDLNFHRLLAQQALKQTRLREPRHLEQLIRSLDQIDWFSAQKDGLGDLYEGLLEKNAGETKSGAGQYFTPRVLINSMVRCIKPQPGEVIQDPAAGTAGFLIAADQYIKSKTDDLYDLPAKGQQFQKNKAFVGVELVPSTRRLALMNCLLHGMEGDAEGVVHQGNALGMAGQALPKADIILANPPFGTAKGGEASITRDDLTYPTSNKQLAFLQHIYRNLKPGGRAAVVLPDNVLFEAGVGTDVRRDLMNKCNLHTILRLPTGIFTLRASKPMCCFSPKALKPINTKKKTALKMSGSMICVPICQALVNVLHLAIVISSRLKQFLATLPMVMHLVSKENGVLTLKKLTRLTRRKTTMLMIA